MMNQEGGARETQVKIEISYGASLKDPTHLLAGEGKLHRHVAVVEPSALKALALKALLKEAFAAWKLRTGSIESRPATVTAVR
ncbi:MAG TPA: hypothetical protein VH639_27175 [Bryobacteraceae bacterium]|jgi:hypothetical protein